MLIHNLITEQARQNPDRISLIFKEDSITFGDLQEKINRVAGGLNQLGIKKGDSLGLVLRNCPEFIVFTMALAKLGAIAVPINFLEKPDRIALILNDAGAVGILTAKEYLKSVTLAAQQTPSMKFIFSKEEHQKEARNFSDLLKAPAFDGSPQVDENDLMMFLYTSGTTGLPKGVMLTHKNFLTNVNQCMEAIEIKKTDKFLCLLPMFHAFAWTTCVLIPLKTGLPCVINESLLPFDPVIKSIWHHKITIFVAVPQIYSALSSKIEGVKAWIVRFLNPIRICISGAAPLPASVHQKFEKKFGIPLLEGYGLTETSPVSSLNPIKKRKTGTVGKPLPGVQIEIHNDEEKPLGPEEVGEIWIKGPHVMKGYYKKPAETQEVLTSDGWFKTGDLGKFDSEGYLSIVDRKKDLIIVKGLNVYPQEIEQVISQVPEVNEVAVVGKMDPDTGEETIRAFITPKEGQEINKTDVFAICRKDLAPYKRPKDVIILKEMPKNALQKILKKELRKL